MAVKRLKIMATIVAAVMGLGTVGIGLRELLIPQMMQDYVEKARSNYGLVQQLGIYILVWGVLLLIFCWYLRFRNFWFIVSLVVIVYGVLYILSPGQSLGILKQIYLGTPTAAKIAAGVKMVVGALLVASIRIGD